MYVKKKRTIYYRLFQLGGWLLGARIFMLMFFVFSLYVSTFFLFQQEETLRSVVFDVKIHGIIFCSVLSLAAGGIINVFYDWEKDRLQKPFGSRLRSFLQQKYFLYSYIFLNLISLGIALFLSFRIFLFFVFYQFFIWLYSHKLSRVAWINNLSYVSLSLYPFFGILVYYHHISDKIFWMAVYLFILLLVIDIMKDFLTIRVDKFFMYNTLPNTIGVKNTVKIILGLLLFCMGVSYRITDILGMYRVLSWYYYGSVLVFVIIGFILALRKSWQNVWLMNLLRFWVFAGVVFMLIDGILQL